MQVAAVSELLKLIYSLRGDAILTLPRVTTTTYEIRSWSYQTARLWNLITNELRTINNYRSFNKNKIKHIELTLL